MRFVLGVSFRKPEPAAHVATPSESTIREVRHTPARNPYRMNAPAARPQPQRPLVSTPASMSSAPSVASVASVAPVAPVAPATPVSSSSVAALNPSMVGRNAFFAQGSSAAPSMGPHCFECVKG